MEKTKLTKVDFLGDVLTTSGACDVSKSHIRVQLIYGEDIYCDYLEYQEKNEFWPNGGDYIQPSYFKSPIVEGDVYYNDNGYWYKCDFEHVVYS